MWDQYYSYKLQCMLYNMNSTHELPMMFLHGPNEIPIGMGVGCWQSLVHGCCGIISWSSLATLVGSAQMDECLISLFDLLSLRS